MEVKEILKQRQESHGDFSDNARFTQIYKNRVREEKFWNQLTFSKKESIDMIIHKLARICTGNFKWLDTWYDIVGYAQLIVNREVDNSDKPISQARLPFAIDPESLPLIYKCIAEAIIIELLTAVFNPTSIKPWKNIIELAQYIIDELEREGEVRIQR